MRKSIQTLLCAIIVAIPVGAAINQPVRTANGQIAGAPSADAVVVAFKGIPYAAPPVGDLRWRAPARPISWKGVRKAEEFGDSCIQSIVEERKPWTFEFMAHNKIGEDCMYLNVWTPAKAASDKLPVYFWIHGGGYVEGSSAVAVYNGENLARRGVVVVTINYRLGVFGFLAHPELTKEADHSGNYGLLDQVAALKWVQRNIAAFGGDPGNVTISGQSAGAGSVHSLVASPLATGLFHRAIAESGAGYVAQNRLQNLAQAERNGANFAAAKGAKGLKELRALSPEKLMAKISDGPSSAFRPIIEGYFLTADPNEIYAQEKQNDVPELTGMNLDERSSTPDYGIIPVAAYRTTVAERYGDLASAFFKLYPNGAQAESGASQKAAFRDAGLVSMFMWAELRAKTAKNKAFTYYWTHAEPGPDRDRYGAFHTSEVPYVFNTLNESKRPWMEEDRKIADTMGAFWVNFMKSGDPNGGALPQWAAFTPNSAVTMELGNHMGTRPVAGPPKLDFWRQYLMRSNSVVP